MHESAVSRVTTNKYMSTPRGLFELKYFFSAAIPATGGGEAHSAEAVRYRIKQLIDKEDPDDVLSDDQIVEILTGYGVEIARRTVAKYRESLHIPSSVHAAGSTGRVRAVANHGLRMAGNGPTRTLDSFLVRMTEFGVALPLRICCRIR
nr:hypothetical protein [uncultured Hyphomonas sp.]